MVLPLLASQLRDAMPLDSLSSTQLYVLLVTLTVGVSFILLGTSSSSEPPRLGPSAATNEKNQGKRRSGPEPRWHLFSYVNYAIVAAFGWSVFEFFHSYALYTQNTQLLLRFLVAWSVCLCYFFGFFGVSFVHSLREEEDNAVEDTVVVSGTVTRNNTAKEGTSLDKGIASTISSPGKTITNTRKEISTKTIHPPAACTPVCSDPSSFRKETVASVPALTKEQVQALDDEQVAQLVLDNHIKDHELEKKLDPHRAVVVRRKVMQDKLDSLERFNAMERLPHLHSLDYSQVHGANCEIVIGYVPLPVGLVGPLTVNGETYYVPMATTEGCLVASTNRGAKAISAGGGAMACIVKDGITRAPLLRMPSAMEAAQVKIWCEEPHNFEELKRAFESTTSFGKLKTCQVTVAGKNVYLRLTCFAGDAMGMNMVSKGSLAVIECLKHYFPSLKLVALSGNMCTDKKAAASNWIEGRGKSVVVEATIPQKIVHTVLKTSVKSMVETNLHKNLIGSAMAGTIGGFNAHASNIVTAVFLATGQDPAQNVESSNCITLLEETDDGDLWMSCTMPSLEVGTVGGGTSLAAQAACLEMIGVKGGGKIPGENAKKLAMIVASATMAGELSLLAALAANTLVQAHMQHNRKKA